MIYCTVLVHIFLVYRALYDIQWHTIIIIIIIKIIMIIIIISSHICFNCQAPGAGLDQLGQTVVSVILIARLDGWD